MHQRPEVYRENIRGSVGGRGFGGGSDGGRRFGGGTVGGRRFGGGTVGGRGFGRGSVGTRVIFNCVGRECKKVLLENMEEE